MLARTLGRPFRVLGIESSADDTCAAIVDASRRVWSNVVVSQNHIHKHDGGIHPLVALLAHQRNMGPGRGKPADGRHRRRRVHQRPRAARVPQCLPQRRKDPRGRDQQAHRRRAPHAHALTAHLTSDAPPTFPFLSLLVSGGHTMIVLVSSLVDFRIIVNTVDRSIGATIDRVVTLLQIPWTDKGPGPGLEKFCAAAPHNPGPKYDAPIPMPGKLAFSYSGLHSWVERSVSAAGGLDRVDRHGLACAFQTAAFEQLETKLLLALRWCSNNGYSPQRIAVSGGVASNAALRQRLHKCLRLNPIELVFPDPALCTDNAAMIAWASMHRFLAGDHDDYAIAPLPSWSLEDLQNPPSNEESTAALLNKHARST